MRAVVRRGETSGSESDAESDREDERARASEAVTTPRARVAASSVDASSSARVSTRDARADGNGRGGAGEGARDARARAARAGTTSREGWETPNTKLVASASAWLREAPVARGHACARARERELMILTQTSASVNAVGGHAREAVVATREATAATRRLATRGAAERRASDG